MNEYNRTLPLYTRTSTPVSPARVCVQHEYHTSIVPVDTYGLHLQRTHTSKYDLQLMLAHTRKSPSYP